MDKLLIPKLVGTVLTIGPKVNGNSFSVSDP